MVETLPKAIGERVRTSFSSLCLAASLWRLNRKLDRSIGRAVSTGHVNLDAARILMNDPQVIEAARSIQSYAGSQDKAYNNIKTIMDKLSPAQKTALIMVQTEYLNKLLHP